MDLLEAMLQRRSCDFYGAPVALLILMDEALPKGRLVDVGIFLGYLLLSAQALGLGTCPLGLIASYQDVILDYLVRQGKAVVVGVALGYPDHENPLNGVRTPREDLREFAPLLGF